MKTLDDGMKIIVRNAILKYFERFPEEKHINYHTISNWLDGTFSDTFIYGIINVVFNEMVAKSYICFHEAGEYRIGTLSNFWSRHLYRLKMKNKIWN